MNCRRCGHAKWHHRSGPDRHPVNCRRLTVLGFCGCVAYSTISDREAMRLSTERGYAIESDAGDLSCSSGPEVA